MRPEIYESVVTQHLQERLHDTDLSAAFDAVPVDDEAHVYARHIAGVVERHLSQVDKADRLTAANDIIARLADGALDVLTRRELLASMSTEELTAPVRVITTTYRGATERRAIARSSQGGS